MSFIITPYARYSFDEIRQHGSGLVKEHDPAFSKTFALAQQWLSGDDEFVFYTSGSTGTPKAIKLKRSQLEASAQGTIEALQLDPSEHILLCMNTAFIGGAMLLIRGLILNAAITVQEPSGDPLQHIPLDHPYSFASFTPIQLHELSAGNPAMRAKLNRFKHILVGGAAVSNKLEQELKTLTTKVYHTYGMTETVSHIALKQIGTDAGFKILPGVQVRTDERDCIQIRSGATDQQWIRTNDVVQLIDDHTFELLGRADDVINTGGIKVFPGKIEPAIQEAVLQITGEERNLFVSWMPDDKLGQMIIAVIEGDPLPQNIERDLVNMLQLKLNRYEIPKAFYYYPAFVQTASGKINKGEILKIIGGKP